MPYLLLALIAVIALVLIVLKTNAALVFFALCGGAVLVQFASKNIAYINGHLNSHLVPKYLTVHQPAVLLSLLFAPPIVAAVLSKRTSTISRLTVQLPSAIATGIMAILLAIPLVSASFQSTIEKAKYWNYLSQYQIVIVIVCVAVALFSSVFSTYSGGHSSKKHHRL